jgi:hypothetical protein
MVGKAARRAQAVPREDPGDPVHPVAGSEVQSIALEMNVGGPGRGEMASLASATRSSRARPEGAANTINRFADEDSMRVAVL